jgi:hypothetical protein
VGSLSDGNLSLYVLAAGGCTSPGVQNDHVWEEAQRHHLNHTIEQIIPNRSQEQVTMESNADQALVGWHAVTCGYLLAGAGMVSGCAEASFCGYMLTMLLGTTVRNLFRYYPAAITAKGWVVADAAIWDVLSSVTSGDVVALSLMRGHSMVHTMWLTHRPGVSTMCEWLKVRAINAKKSPGSSRHHGLRARAMRSVSRVNCPVVAWLCHRHQVTGSLMPSARSTALLLLEPGLQPD